MRGRRLIHLLGPLTHCCEKRKESVNQPAKIGKLCSESTVIKKFIIIAEVPTITAFVAAFDAKALNCTELLESYLTGWNRSINCHRQTNRNRHNWNMTQYKVYALYKNHICIFYLYCKKGNTLHLYSMHKNFKAQREDHVATLTTAVNITVSRNFTPHVKQARDKNLLLIPCLLHLWSEVTWIQVCASLKHRKKKESRAQSADSSKDYEKPSRTFNCSLFACFTFSDW